MAQGAGVGDGNCPAWRLGQGTGIGMDAGCCCCPAQAEHGGSSSETRGLQMEGGRTWL